LGTAAYFNSDFDKAERLSHDAALLATDLGMDKVASVAYGTLYSLAAMNDSNVERARSFSRSQAAAAERAANIALHVYALRVQYIIAAVDGDTNEADALESALASMVDSRSHRETTFLFRQSRALQHLYKGEVMKAEAVMQAMPLASLTPSERIRSDSLLTLLGLLRGKRPQAVALLERGHLSEAPSDFAGRIEMAYAYAYRGVAFWVLDRPAQARRQFELNVASLPRRDQIFFDAFKALSALPHPLPNSAAIDDLHETLVGAGFRAYATLLRLLVELDANDVELSAAELETLREFDRFGGRASDVAKALGKSKYTVQNQIQSAIKKLGCSGRAEALAYARQRGWLDRASN
jgi:DNA-binding CsgD family transcriptional regulator